MTSRADASDPAGSRPPRLGAELLPGGRARFAVWSPRADHLSVELLGRRPGESPRLVRMAREGEVLTATVDGVAEGDRYYLVFPDGRRRPDPRSRRQPEGVHGPSALVDLERLRPPPAAALPPFADWTIYELHVGTFTPEGTFDAATERLGYLKDELGVSAIELMPVSPFPGTRGWGYDGVHPFAVQESYGGPEGLARLVAAAHGRGLAVILDVVYNHLGPDGNYLRDFAPYFTDRHRTPWGEAVNFDGPASDGVRAYVIENAVSWIRDYRLDGLRLDAVHAIHDDSEPHVLAELAAAVQAAGGRVIAESDLNDPVTVRPRREGGWGCDAQWSDDFHHALHALLTGERNGYYLDFGKASDLSAAYERAFVYDGSRPSPFREGLRHGKAAAGVPAEKHVVCLQNHDQVGNRARGDRVSHVAGLEAARIGAVAALLSPGIPLLFQGEEWATARPFPYFTSHTDPVLARAVSDGRRREFEAFAWQGEVPDPQDEATFRSAILSLEERREPGHRGVLALYRRLLELRRAHPALGGTDRGARLSSSAADCGVVILERWSEDGRARVVAMLAFGPHRCDATARIAPGRWSLLVDGADPLWGGSGSTAPTELHVPASGRIDLTLPRRGAWVYEWLGENGAVRR